MRNDNIIVDQKPAPISQERAPQETVQCPTKRYTHDLSVTPMLSHDELTYFTKLTHSPQKAA
ncbi:MAG: hypothetical protein JKY11_04495 [Alphaproteobacteria bacterium]|nr:hypothetical protein [Alphaproteobacteria bacterium]